MIVSERIKERLVSDLKSAKTPGTRSEVINQYSKKLNKSEKTIYRYAKNFGWKSGRKTRKDAGVREGYKPHLDFIAAIYNKESNNQPLELSIKNYIKNHPNPNSIELPKSVSQVAALLRKLGISKKDFAKPKPHIHMISLYSNHCHQLDASRCRWYMRPDGKVIPLSKKDYYKNKPFIGDKKKIPIVRLAIVDHLSNAFFVLYTFQQKIIDWADFLYQAWKPKGDEFIFHGVPEILILDNDTALRSYALLRFFEYLGIRIPNVMPYAPRVKGSVEKVMHIWEIWFESQLLFQQPKDIDELNQWAFEYAIWFQNARIVTRHGMSRFSKWRQKIDGHLKLLPDYTTFQTLLHYDPVSRKVNNDGEFWFDNRKYKLKGIFDTKVDVTIHPYLYEKDFSVTVQYPARELNPNNFVTNNIQTFTIAPYQSNADGLAPHGAVWGQYKGIKFTDNQLNQKKVEEASQNMDMEIKPFDNIKHEEKVKYIPIVGGRLIQASSQISFKEREFEKVAAKVHLVDLLKRPLKPEEIEFINTHEKEIFTESELEKIAEQFSQKTAKREAK
jgi:hypothetical protein